MDFKPMGGGTHYISPMECALLSEYHFKLSSLTLGAERRQFSRASCYEG